ncbi:MAG: response regulator [bacterium]|nr:response regulator [bacterium]
MAHNTVSKGDILIVDDTLANLRVLKELLTGEGYHVRPVPNGALALNAVHSKLPDLILLDINMPGMDGYEVCRRLKDDAQTRDVPVIFVSAQNEVFDKVKAFELGGVDYIPKPFQIEEVLVRVENHLSIRRLQEALEQANGELERANEVLEQRVAERTEALKNQMELFRKFVPETFTRTLDQGQMDVREGLAREEVYTIFSCDIRDFTTFSESVTCEACYAFLNSYFTVMEPGIRKFGGFVYQYVGDEIMALFKLEEDQYADNAVRAAVEIQNRILVDYNLKREEKGSAPIRIGVGLNTGPVAIGVAGTSERMDACAFGSAVNLAARCEGLTKELDASIILTEHTYRHLNRPDAFDIRDLGMTSIRGLAEAVHLYAVLDVEGP